MLHFQSSWAQVRRAVGSRGSDTGEGGVRMAAGIMGNIFDGIQRPLKLIYNESGRSPFVPLGVDVSALNR